MFRRAVRRLVRVFLGVVVVALVAVGAGIAVLETGWAKDRLRDLIVAQANEYLTATLSIESLSGSILRGLQLGRVQLLKDGRTLVSIDEIALSYSIRELIESGTIIRKIRLTRPQFAFARQADGRWDIAAIVKRERREGPQTGPSRAIVIQSVEIVDGRVHVANPLDFGAAHAPTQFDQLNASFAFAYYPVRWRLDFQHVSWIGREPELTMTKLAGALGSGPGGWFFDTLTINTPQSLYTVSGRIIRGDQPTALDLTVHADRFAFQEWSGVLRGLRNIAVTASFDTTLRGPTTQLGTDIRLAGTGGSVSGHLTLDTSVPGWRGAGTVDVSRINLAQWLNNPNRPSEITGRVAFDLALELGRHFPRGVYRFDGPHAMYMNYAADNVRANGQITETAVLVREATARAYGSTVSTHDGSIGIDSPFPYRFIGKVTQIDLRNVPASVPVPHVESRLTFTYDVNGTFSEPFIAGNARFAPSVFLGAQVGDGTEGTIDTRTRPIHYTGEGDVADANLNQFGEGLDVAWLRDPRYAGTVSGHFRVDGTGTNASTMTLTANGRITHASLFRGTLGDADVSMTIEDGSLQAAYSGRFANVDPAVPFADARWQAALSGRGTMSAAVPGLLIRNVTLADYDVTGSLQLTASTVHQIPLTGGSIDATLQKGMLTVRTLQAEGPAIEGQGSGTVALDETQTTTFDYDIRRADPVRLESLTGLKASGAIASKGRVVGPWSELHFSGDGSIAQLDAFSVRALTIGGSYDATVPTADPSRTTARLAGNATFLVVAGQPIDEAAGTISVDPADGAQRIGVDLRVKQAEGRSGTIAASFLLRSDQRSVEVTDATIGLGTVPWRLARQGRASTVRWDEHGFSIDSLALVTGTNDDERIAANGTWRDDGTGVMRVTAAHVFLENLQRAFERPTRYGGVLDADMTIRGTSAQPVATGTFTVSNGRVERVNYQRFAARVDYADRLFTVDARLDQSPGVFVTAKGTAPLALFDRSLPPRPIDMVVQSSGINLGLIEGVTDVVRGVSGELRVDVHAIGSSDDPHFTGALVINGGGFTVTSTNVPYRNAVVALTVQTDRVIVERFHVEDSNGRALELTGSLGTHELRVGELEVDITANRFEVMRNAYGRLQIDARLQARGRAETPQLTGDLTVSSGELRVDEILQRTVFRPYSTQETTLPSTDPLVAMNPWQRLGMNLTLHVPNTLRLAGDNVQVSTGTPIGLGDIALRVAGDLYLYKDPGAQLYVTGSFDTVTGTYAFQGRRFDVDPASSILFRGDGNPDLYVGVTREIQGVQTRVVLTGQLDTPELKLTSIPPLEESDILSLIVFNTSTNQLTAQQQQDLLVRAGTLAVGFLATPLVSALSKQIGLDILEVETGGGFANEGPRFTIGQELAPGLVARFSRQFGPEPYDEATIEYYLSKILRLRATFSDAQTLTARSPFRRIERAGIDLLFFFSF